MINYFYDCYCILNKVYSDKAYLKQAILDTIIEEKNRALTIKTVYGVIEKDIELSYYLKRLTNKSPKLAIRTILKIAIYAIKHLGKKPYAVTESAVELTKKLGKKGASGFVNAILRNFLRNEIQLPTDQIENLSIKYSYPEFAVKRLVKDYGRKRAESIMGAEIPNTCLSFFDIDGENYLKEKCVNYTKTPYENVFFVKNFVRDEGFNQGLYTFQSIGSVAICDGVEPCESILDCCSAPGGKSVRLSYKCKNVYASELHEHRVNLINSYARRMKRDNITVSCADATIYNLELKDKFDAVLCDAPCSGLGVVGDNPDIKLNREESSILELNDIQLKILNNVSKYVKKDGYLYYSTCSILKSENIEIVEKFIKENPNFAIVPVNSKIPADNQKGTLAFLPDLSFGVGFYFAKLKRVR